MKHTLLAFFALFVLPTTVSARTPEPAGPALWVVKDADTTIYLFGTMHILPPDTDWLKPTTVRAFDSADTLVLEAITPDNSAELQSFALSLGVNPKQPPLKDRLDAAHAAKLATIIGQVGLPAPALDVFDTWMAGVTLTIGQMTALGMDPDHGVEEQLTARAKRAGKPIVALETVEEQLRLFDGLPETDQRAMLVQTIDEFDTFKSQLDEELSAWLGGDAERIAAQMNKDLRASPLAFKLLLTDRNAHWTDWIVKRMDQPGTIFVAVGAGHLAGTNSVQSMLAKRGLKAERVSN